MADIPNELAYFVGSLENVSVNTFKVNAQTTGDVTSSRSIKFTLPNNTILNMRDVRFAFSVDTSGTGETRAPPSHLLVNRVAISCGGIPLDSGCNNFGVLQEILRIAHPHDCDLVDEHDEIYRNQNQTNLMDLSGQSEVSSAPGVAYYTMSLGPLFDTIEPALLDTSLLAELQVEIFLANSNVVLCPTSSVTIANFTVDSNVSNAEFTIKNYHLICPCVALGDPAFERMVSSAMQMNNYVPVQYHQYYNFASTYNGDFIGSNGSMCLNKLIAVFRDNGFDARGLAPRKRLGYAKDTTLTARGQSDAGTQGNNATVVFQGEEYPANEKYVSPQLDFHVPVDDSAGNTSLARNIGQTTNQVTTVPLLNWRVSNVMQPNYQVPIYEWYRLSKQALDSKKMDAKSLPEFMQNRYIVAQATNLPNTPVRRKTGIDMRNSTSQIRLESNGNGLKTDSDIQVYFQCTTELQIGSGLRISVLN
jgi:hypothetical protein